MPILRARQREAGAYHTLFLEGCAGREGEVLMTLDRDSFLGLMGQSKKTEGAIARTVANRLIDLASGR
jgi:hypothetical protein